MAENRSIKIEIVVDADGAVRKLKEFDGATEQVEKRVKATNPLIGELSGTLARYASIAAVGAAIKSTVQYADDLKTMSDRTQITVKELQRLSFAAGQNGSDIQAVTTVIGTMSDRLAGGDASARAAVKKLGLEFNALRAMRPEDAFKVIGRELAGIDDKMKQIQIAKDLGGLQGFGILPTWTSDLEDLGDQAERLNLIVGKDSVEAAARFDSAMSAAWMGLKAQIMDTITLGPKFLAAFPMLGVAGQSVDLMRGFPTTLPTPGGPRTGPPIGAGPDPRDPESAMRLMDLTFGTVQAQLAKIEETKRKLAAEADALSKLILTQNDERIAASLSFFEQDFTMLVGHLARKRQIELNNAQIEFTDVANREIAKLAIIKNFQEQERALRIASQTAVIQQVDTLQGQMFPGPAQNPLEAKFNSQMQSLVKAQEEAFMLGMDAEVERLQTMRTTLENDYIVAMHNAGQETVNAAGATAVNAAALNAVTTAAGNAGIELVRLGDNLNLLTQRAAVGVVHQGGGQFGGPASGFDLAKALELYNIGRGGFTTPGANFGQDFPSWLRDQMKNPLRGFANGGVVDRPTLAMIGEGGEREFVIPESKMGGGGMTVIVNAQGAVFENDRALDRLADKMQQKLAAKFGQGTRLPGRA